MKTFRTAALLGALALPASAGPLWTLPFQGVATDSTGRPRPDGSVAVVFALHDAATGGNQVWTETDSVRLRKGLFSLELGASQQLPIDQLGRAPLWLSVAFPGEAPVEPRMPLGRSAESWYAHASGTADRALLADTAGYARSAPMRDTSMFATRSDSARASRRSDTAKYAAKAPLGVVVVDPLVLSDSGDTLKIKPGTSSGNFLTWDGTNWVAKTPTYLVSAAGGSQPLPIRNPYLGVNFIIALQGIFPSRSGVDPFVGEIEMVAFNFAPNGWALCNGQIMAINSNQALFSLLGTQYGGNGQTTFALPNLQGRVPVQFGQGPGLSSIGIGETGGSENVTILQNQMPAHNHVVQASP